MSKYKAKPTVIDGIRFASKAEARRYCELKMLEKKGAIADLETQVPYPIHVAGIRVGKYLADFVYTERGEMKVEDVKGVRTQLYRFKKRCVEAEHKIKIIEVAA